MANFKLGFAAVLSILTAGSIVAANVDKLNAMGETLDGIMGIALAVVSFTVALPIWLMAITCWHKLHNRSYRAFKNWCINLYHIIDAD